jgi:hypothetical protein
MAKMTKDDWQLVRQAVNHAINERESYKGSFNEMHPDDQLRKDAVSRCDDFIERAEAFCLKHFGQNSAVKKREEMAKIKSTSIFEMDFKNDRGN